jgi:hypothetical protein
VLQDDAYYQGTWRPSSFSGNSKEFFAAISDFPGNATILSINVEALDEQERPADVSNGIFVGNGIIVSDTQLTLLMACKNNRNIVPVIPHYMANVGPSSGPNLFSDQDSSEPTIGMWAKRYFNQQTLQIQVVNLDPNHNKTVTVKVEMDFVVGSPKREAFRQQFIPEFCENQSLVRDGGQKKYVYKTKTPMRFTVFGDVISMRKFLSWS